MTKRIVKPIIIVVAINHCLVSPLDSAADLGYLIDCKLTQQDVVTYQWQIAASVKVFRLILNCCNKIDGVPGQIPLESELDAWVG